MGSALGGGESYGRNVTFLFTTLGKGEEGLPCPAAKEGGTGEEAPLTFSERKNKLNRKKEIFEAGRGGASCQTNAVTRGGEDNRRQALKDGLLIVSRRNAMAQKTGQPIKLAAGGWAKEETGRRMIE